MERGHEIKVLDDGFVRYVDHMGGDEDVVEAARVSTGRGFVSWDLYVRCTGKCADVKAIKPDRLPEKGAACLDCGGKLEIFPRGDLGILEYLMKNRHTTPFEMCEVKLHVRVPMDCWRQWIRHRTANVNEYSTRYSPAIDSAARTAPDRWRTQGATNRQGSGGYLMAGEGSPILREDRELATDGSFVDFSRAEAPGHWLSRRERELHEFSRSVYEDRLALGVAREQARKDLPLSTYTEAYWKCDLHNTLHFLGLRLHSHAQEEIRRYAEAVAEIVRALWPRTYALFEEWQLGSVRLSRTEKDALAALVRAAGRGEEVAGIDVDKLLKRLCE